MEKQLGFTTRCGGRRLSSISVKGYQRSFFKSKGKGFHPFSVPLGLGEDQNPSTYHIKLDRTAGTRGERYGFHKIRKGEQTKASLQAWSAWDHSRERLRPMPHFLVNRLFSMTRGVTVINDERKIELRPSHQRQRMKRTAKSLECSRALVSDQAAFSVPVRGSKRGKDSRAQYDLPCSDERQAASTIEVGNAHIGQPVSSASRVFIRVNMHMKMDLSLGGSPCHQCATITTGRLSDWRMSPPSYLVS